MALSAGAVSSVIDHGAGVEFEPGFGLTPACQRGMNFTRQAGAIHKRATDTDTGASH